MPILYIIHGFVKANSILEHHHMIETNGAPGFSALETDSDCWYRSAVCRVGNEILLSVSSPGNGHREQSW